jgi:hypothetical protein
VFLIRSEEDCHDRCVLSTGLGVRTGEAIFPACVVASAFRPVPPHGLAPNFPPSWFHAYQMLEAGVRQFQEWGNCDQGRQILIAIARYLAAHFPTQRALLQTADIASRLMRGGELHRDATQTA